MTDCHFDKLGFVRMGDRLALRAFCAPKKDDNFDDKVERLNERLNGRGKQQGDQTEAVGGAGRNKRSLKSTLKVEFGQKHFSSGKYMQVKKSKGGGTRSVYMNGTAQYDECIQKGRGLQMRIHCSILQTRNWRRPPLPLCHYNKGYTW